MGIMILAAAFVCLVLWVVWEALTAPEDPRERETGRWHDEAEGFRKERGHGEE